MLNVAHFAVLKLKVAFNVLRVCVLIMYYQETETRATTQFSKAHEFPKL